MHCWKALRICNWLIRILYYRRELEQCEAWFDQLQLHRHQYQCEHQYRCPHQYSSGINASNMSPIMSHSSSPKNREALSPVISSSSSSNTNPVSIRMKIGMVERNARIPARIPESTSKHTYGNKYRSRPRRVVRPSAAILLARLD